MAEVALPASGRGVCMGRRTPGGAVAEAHIALTDRQLRERAYYDEYARRHGMGMVSFAPALGRERRPWNAYWRLFEIARERFAAGARRLLDFGSGPGGSALLFARIGYEVHGFDISETNVVMARELAEQYGVADRTRFTVQAAERLDYPDEWFDLVVGIDILHHVELSAALAECLRVLKPGCPAIYHEPVEAPVFDALRNSRLGRWLVPKGASFERHVTEDERKLSAADIGTIRAICPDVTLQPYMLLSRLDRFVRYPAGLPWSPLERVDGMVMSAVPCLGRFAGKVTLQFSKPA
jgi:2-polyprenyl-3-methyl-5-hydroxy-6-metoxy-1,4-benzoquinol methylase